MSAFGDNIFGADPESWARSHLKELETVISRTFEESRALRAELARTQEIARKSQADLTAKLRALHAEANRRLQALHAEATAELQRVGAEKAALAEEIKSARAKQQAIETALSQKCAENERLRHANAALKKEQDIRFKELLDQQYDERSGLEARIAMLEADRASLEARVRGFSRASPSGAYAHDRGRPQGRETSFMSEFESDPMIFVDGPTFPERRR